MAGVTLNNRTRSSQHADALPISHASRGNNQSCTVQLSSAAAIRTDFLVPVNGYGYNAGMNSQKTRGRWFRFSLRTLFVLVTLVCFFTCWLTYQYSWIKQRRNAFKWIAASSNEDYWIAPSLIGAPVQAAAPWSLRLLGESGVVAIGVHKTTEEKRTDRPQFSRAELRQLFPEARVDWSVNGNMWDNQKE